MEVKFEIKLKAKEPINGYKTGETVIIVNPIFDRNIGVAFFPIDKNFDLVYQRQFIGLKDENGIDTYIGDIVTNDDSDCNLLVVFKNGAFCLQPLLTKKTPTANIGHLEFMRIVGNRFENPELLEDFVF